MDRTTGQDRRVGERAFERDAEPAIWVLSADEETSTMTERDALVAVWRARADGPGRLLVVTPGLVELYGTGSSHDGLAAAADAGVAWPMAGLALRRHRGRAAIRHAALLAAGADTKVFPPPASRILLAAWEHAMETAPPDLDPLLWRLGRLVIDVSRRGLRLCDRIVESDAPLGRVAFRRSAEEMVEGAIDGYLAGMAAATPRPEPPVVRRHDPESSLAALRELGEIVERRRVAEASALFARIPRLGSAGHTLLEAFSRRLVASVLKDAAAALRDDPDGSAEAAARLLFRLPAAPSAPAEDETPSVEVFDGPGEPHAPPEAIGAARPAAVFDADPAAEPEPEAVAG